MKIVIFGASGGTGRFVVEQALAQGHCVTAFDRHPEALTIRHPKLTIMQGDVFHLTEVETGVMGHDAVVCVLGVKPTTTQPVCSMGTKHIISAMQKHGVRRLVCQSASAVAAIDRKSHDVPWLLPMVLPCFPKVRSMFADKVLQEQFICQSNLDWIIVRPATLTNTPLTGHYTVGVPLAMSLTSKIARADVAHFLLKQLSDDTYLHKVPRIRY